MEAEGRAVPEAAEQVNEATPVRTWGPMILWTAGILAALGLAWPVGAVAVPVWRTRAIVREYNKMADPVPEGAIRRLGGPDEAAQQLGVFIRMPDWFTGRDSPVGGAGSEEKAFAVELLARCGRPAVRPLIRALKTGAPAVRLNAARALAVIGPEAEEAAPHLIVALDDPTNVARYDRIAPVPIRLWVIAALRRIGPPAAAAVPKLERALHDQNEDVRCAADSALEMLRGQEPPR